MGWLVLGAYAAMAAWTWRHFAMKHVEFCARDELARRREQAKRLRYNDPDAWLAAQGELVPDHERSYGAAMGAMAGLLWPLSWFGFGALRLLAISTGNLTPPTERAMNEWAAERKELAELRKLAREHGLPMPGNDSEKGAA